MYTLYQKAMAVTKAEGKKLSKPQHFCDGAFHFNNQFIDTFKDNSAGELLHYAHLGK